MKTWAKLVLLCAVLTSQQLCWGALADPAWAISGFDVPRVTSMCDAFLKLTNPPYGVLSPDQKYTFTDYGSGPLASVPDENCPWVEVLSTSSPRVYRDAGGRILLDTPVYYGYYRHPADQWHDGVSWMRIVTSTIGLEYLGCPQNSHDENGRCLCDAPDYQSSPDATICWSVLRKVPKKLCTPTFGDPILPMTGAMYHDVDTGFAVDGFPLKLTYNTHIQIHSNAGAAYRELQGFGGGGLWTTNFHRRLAIARDTVTAYRGGGEIAAFDVIGTPATGLSYVPEGGSTTSLSKVGSLYYLKDRKSKVVEQYDDEGRLIAMRYADGKSLYFTYSVGASNVAPDRDYLIAITGTSGSGVGFAYQLAAGADPVRSGVIAAISDTAGRTIGASYGPNGQLGSLNWPDGSSIQFKYENVSLPWAMTSLVDELGVTLSSWSYDTSGRAISNVLGGGVEPHAVTYQGAPQLQCSDSADAANQRWIKTCSWTPPVAPSVLLPSGTSTTLGTLMVNGYPVSAGQTQEAGSGCAASASAQTYDALGNVTSRDSFTGSRTCFVYDTTRNLEIARVEGLPVTQDCGPVTAAGAAIPVGARKITTAWHAQWDLPIRVEEPNRRTTYIYNGQPDTLTNGNPAQCVDRDLAVLCKKHEQSIDLSTPAAVVEYSYDLDGKILTSKDGRGNVTTYSYYKDPQFAPLVAAGDPFYNQVQLLLHADGLEGDKSTVDSSNAPKKLTFSGNTKISTSQGRFGGSAIYFDGASVSSYATVSDIDPIHPNALTSFQFLSDDFTIEMWVYPTAWPALEARLMAVWNNSREFRLSLYQGQVRFEANDSAASMPYATMPMAFSATGAVPLNVWSHVAVVRHGSQFTIYVNGSSAGGVVATSSARLNPAVAPAILGIDSELGVDYAYKGYIDEVRVTKGVARYTSDFVAPQQSHLNQIPSLDASAIGHRIGDVRSITNAAGHTTQYTQYDGAGRVRQSIDSKGVVTDITYTPRGKPNTISVTAPGGAARVTYYSYDFAGQLKTIQNPDGTTLSYSYDSAHRLLGITDAAGNSVSYILDAAGNRTAENVRDMGGNLQRSISRSIDALNRVQQVVGAAR